MTGAITVADLDLLQVEFDAEVIGRDISLIRLESGGSFGNRVDLIPTLSGSYQTYSFDFSTLDAVQKANLAAHMNSTGSTELQFTFSFVDNGGGMFEVGNTARFDNFSLVTSVPEPSHLLFCGIGAICFYPRRRR